MVIALGAEPCFNRDCKFYVEDGGEPKECYICKHYNLSSELFRNWKYNLVDNYRRCDRE